MVALAALLAVKSIVLVRAATADAAAPDAGGEAAVPPPVTAAMRSRAAASAAIETPVPKPPVPATPEPPPVSDAERALLQDLRERRRQLDAREAAIAAREAVLAAAEQKLSARVDQLTALQSRLEQLDAARRSHDEQNWQGLVKLYEAMKPRDAAIIFNDLDMTVLLPVLDRMKEMKAAPILAAMQPDRARLATTQLAELRTHETTVPGPGR